MILVFFILFLLKNHKMGWKSISDKKLSDKINTIIFEIADALEKAKRASSNISLISGKTGMALFFYYLGRYSHREKYFDESFKILRRVFEKINSGFNYHSFAGGLSGISWAVEHLSQQNFIDIDTNHTLTEIDPFLYRSMMFSINENNYDYLHGAIGNGLYFLNNRYNKRSKEYLSELVDILDKNKHTDNDGGIMWESVINPDSGQKGYNLSLSHGLAGIIIFLSKLYENSIHKEKVLELLTGAVNYLLKQELDPKQNIAKFPNWITKNETGESSRLAWCYGDLGIGIALLIASQSTGNSKYREKAIHIFLHSVQRKDPEENAVIDAGICHGAAGVAQMYNRMYQYTGIEDFKKAALYWIEVLLQMASFKDGGYKSLQNEKTGNWKTDISLLEGITGIGLVLISTVSNIKPKWDSCLLLS